MSEPTPLSSDAEMRRIAKIAAVVAIGAIIVIALSFLVALDALPLIEPMARGWNTGDWPLLFNTLGAFGLRLIPLVPATFYLVAALGALGILDRISKGEYFSPANIRALGDMGGAMLWGAGWAMLLVPALSDWLARGLGGYRLDLTPETLVIATIGLALLVIGRLFLRAQALESEMEAIV